MTTSSRAGGRRSVPPPAGGKPASPYTRFIPREELGDFASWQPGTFSGAAHGGPGATPGTANAATEPAAPTSDEWQARVSAARQTGYQEGYRDGLVALESFKQSFAQQATAQIGALLEAFDRQLGVLDGEAAMAVASTAVQLARQVLRTELQLRPELVAQVAAEAVNAVMLSARHISVQVHPQDLPLVAEGAAEALQARGARLYANPAIERGGVLVQSDVGAIDARIASRWAQAAAALGSHEPLTGDDGAAA
jgi:flagellar assembly protein FliH